ncbi:MAG: alpha/beta hydrolase [Proteobacteria bacterium]|nr:alpha/beta hydrolase [Pseudomonadota bacterium]
MEYKDLFTDTPTKRIHSIACGHGDHPLHFLHANGFCAGVYLPFLAHFQKDCRMIATDIPGHGDSDHHGYARIEHWNIFVDDVKEALVRHMSPPVIGVGHSLGAVVTLLTAAQYPELFSHIVLIDPVIFTRSRLALVYLLKKAGLIHRIPLAQGARRRKREFTSKEEAYRRFSSGRGLFASWPHTFIKAYCQHGLSGMDQGSARLKCDPETEAQIYESILMDIWDYPGKITCPTLVIRGEDSTTFTDSACRRLCSKISGAKSVSIKHAGHFVAMEKAGECHNHILNFIHNYP